MDLVRFTNKQPNENLLATFRPRNTIKVDDWIETDATRVFHSVDKAITLGIREFYKIEDKPELDYFFLSPKRCYAKPDVRDHIVKYLNYFETFYDIDRELVSTYCHIKYWIDFRSEYGKANLFKDISMRILHNESMLRKIHMMNEDNYQIPLEPKKGKSIQNLQYSTKHGKIMMQMSLLMDMVIPLITHFASIKNRDDINDLLMEVFDEILYMSSADIFSKFYETTTTEAFRNETVHSTMWSMQDIRGKDTITHSNNSIDNIILNIMPKYRYDNNVVSFNFSSIRKNTGFKITDIKYEYDYTQLSSSNRDEDFNSDSDKFESYLVRQDEGLYLQNKCNSEQTLANLYEMFGISDQNEFDFYMKELCGDRDTPINDFQLEKISRIFFKYFGDPNSFRAISNDDYVKLIIIIRKILENINLVILPYIMSGKVVRVPNRKAINKKELQKIQKDPLWKKIQEKYQNPKIEEAILAEIGVVLSSEIKIISYDEPEIHGKTIDMIPDIVSHEYMIYILMI